MKKGICRLCLQEKELCKKSHIIPNFMYDEIFDEKHQMIRHFNDSKRTDPVFNGEYESNILCERCDNKILGGYESYGRQILYGGNIPVNKTEFKISESGLVFSEMTGLDYQQTKLFLLSILWRASISSRPFFNLVKLSPEDEEFIRRMLIAEIKCPETSYPCLMILCRNQEWGGELPYQFVKGPHMVYKDGYVQCVFLIAGVLYIFMVNEDETRPYVLEATINCMGRMRVFHAGKKRTKEMLQKLFDNIQI